MKINYNPKTEGEINKKQFGLSIHKEGFDVKPSETN